MEVEHDPSDRRRHPRTEVWAHALVFSERLHGNFLVRDVSAGGACLVGDLDATRGMPVSVLLQFPGRTALSLSAQVVRQDVKNASRYTAVAFVDLLADEEDAIHEAIVAALEQEHARRSATILVLDGDAIARGTIESDLRAIGHQAVTVATPLDALVWLDRPGTRISTLVVDLTPGPAQGLDMLDFVGEHHPHIQRVVMVDEPRPFRLELALRSGRAHKALRKPWDRAVLVETLGTGREAERTLDTE